MSFQVVPGGGWVGDEAATVPTVPGGVNEYAGYNPYFQDYGVYGPVSAMPSKEQMMPAPAAQAMHVPGMMGDMSGVAESCVPVYGAVPVHHGAAIPAPAPMAPMAVPAVQLNVQSTDEKELETAKLRLKPRWETPRRRGVWTERWQSARALGADSVPLADASRVAASIRQFVSKVINLNVGLPMGTVEKWFHLLAEYLELSADEHVIMIALFRKYIAAKGPLMSQYDWARPQKWECVLAISCYLSVLLSEEFGGQTARELKDLLGPSFHFGREQTDFLKSVDWRINVTETEFSEARDLFMAYDNSTETEASISAWFAKAAKPAATKPAAVKPAAAKPAKEDTAAVQQKAQTKNRKRARKGFDDFEVEVKRPAPSYKEEFAVPSFN